MGIWDKFFGKNKAQKPEKSPFLPKEEDPLDIGFAKNFTKKGGKFLFIESDVSLLKNFKDFSIQEGSHIIKFLILFTSLIAFKKISLLIPPGSPIVIAKGKSLNFLSILNDCITS